MTAEILPGPTPMDGGSDPWPHLQGNDDILQNCGVLFVDIRGSSNLPGGAGLVRQRARDFSHLARSAWIDLETSEGAPSPKLVRLVGDGLFCVWELEGKDAKDNLAGHVLNFFDSLGKRLQETWRFEKRVKIGMGLAFGEAARAVLKSSDLSEGDTGIRDYYGYTINLAAKLQNLARPEGVVIAVPDPEHLSIEKLGQVRPVLSREYPLEMAPGRAARCLATEEVDEIHDWTCLAWPGFAGRRPVDGNRLGLNARGVTVLTHEGLRGKIDSLRIWPRNGYEQAEADQFQFIIDDFDSLQAMHSEKIVSLAPGNQQTDETLVAPAFPDSQQFVFIPIRCGLNAVAWHHRHGEIVERHSSYRETIEHASADPRFRIGLYDNVGASLSILVNAFCPDLEGDEVFSHDSEEHLERVKSELKKLQDLAGKNRKLFRLYGGIERLSRALNADQIDAVLGGGAWLANPKAKDQRIRTHIPPESMGFLWIEGAALVSNLQGGTRKLYEFLRDSVLTDSYQTSLMEGLPYCTCPVTVSLIDRILKDDAIAQTDECSAKQLIFEDTRRIFEDTETLFHRKVIVRQRPTLSSKWDDTWEFIKLNFCKPGER